VAINDAGEVVGVDSPSAALSGSHGYLYDNGIYTILAPSPSTEQWSNAVDINNAGQVLGEYQDGMGEHGFIYDNGNYTILDAPNANPAVGTTVFGFNDLGQVVGSGFTYSDGSYTALDSPQGTLGTSAMAINNSGQIVGSYSVVSQHGFVAIPS
jgi:probable HAF family extracellular repeat protein